MHTGNSIIMHVPPAKIFETAADLEGWPRILPHYRYIRFLERGPEALEREPEQIPEVRVRPRRSCQCI